MCGRRTIARFFGLLTTGLSICITFAAELKIRPAGPVQSQPAGKGFVLTCQGEADDSTLFSEMKWTAPDGEVIESRSSSVVEILQQADNQLALIFKTPSTEESGLYKCTALYANTDKLNISVALTFYQDITWDDCPMEQALVINTTGHIRCKVSANPVATVTWNKNNEPIPEDRYIIDNNGITVSRVTEDDAGTYNMRAMVTQTGRFQTRAITVEVHVPPVITELESHVEFNEGKEAALTCHATGSPQPEYTWFDPKQQDLSDIDGYFVGKDTGTLTIRSVKKEDAGRYRCMAKNDAGESSKFLELTVIVKPEIKQFDNTSAAENAKATLECQATGEPLPVLSIRKDGHEVPFSEDKDDRVTLRRKEEGGRSILTMTIKDIMRSDDGLYYCSAENKGDKVERVGHLTVEFPPVMTKTPSTSAKTWNNNPVNLTCIAEAIPNATIVWWFRGQEIKEGNPSYFQFGTSSYSNLLVKPMKQLGREDVYGQYRCEATNKHGKQEITIELSEGRRPSALSEVKLLKKTATTATFILHRPEDNGGLQIRAFVVEYREAKEPEDSSEQKEWSEGSAYILENLKPRVEYTFKFAARNDAGIGDWSERMHITMPEESAPESPKFITPGGNVSRYPDRFEIRWTLPLNNGRPIEFFQLRYFQVTRDGNDWKIIGKVEVEEIRHWQRAPVFEPKNLNPNSYYKVEVRARNEIGFSQVASMVFRTAEGRDNEEKVADTRMSGVTSLPMAALVAIIVVLLIVVLVAIDVTCYLRYQWGLLYFFRSTLCGKSATGDKAKEAAAEDGKGGFKEVPANNGDVKVEPNSTTPMDKGTDDAEEKSRTEVDNPAFDAKDTKTDTNSMDVKNISPKGSKSSIAKDSLV